MIKLKEKTIQYLIINGKKSINEKKVRTTFKKLNFKYFKKVTNVFQFIILVSSFIFKYTGNDHNSSYFFVSKERIFFAIKQVLKFNIIEHFDNINKELDTRKKLQNTFIENKKLLYFYRWDTNK